MPTSPSPALPGTATSPMAMHLPLFEWGNTAMGPILPIDPTMARRPPKTTYSTSYSTADDAMTGASIADTTMDLTHPTMPVRSNYCARRCRPPPRPSSPSPASPRTPRAPMFGHLPLFEWGNIAVRLVFPIDPTVTRRPPTTPLPALDDIPPALQGSPLPQNLTTPVFDNGECNLNPFYMDDSRLSSIDLDYGNGQPEVSNTSAAEVSNDGLHIPEQLRTNNETQFSPDENEVIEQLMVGAIQQDLDAHVTSSTAGDKGVRNQPTHSTADLVIESPNRTLPAPEHNTKSKWSAKEAFRPARPESPPPAKKIVLTHDDPITESCLRNLHRINLETRASISALQEKNSELERQLLEAKQSYDSMIAEGRDIIAQKNHEIKDNELKLDEVKKSLASTKQQYNAQIAKHEQYLKQSVEKVWIIISLFMRSVALKELKCSHYEADRSSLQEKLRQYDGKLQDNSMPTLETAVEVAKPYEKKHEEIKKTAAATQTAEMHLKNQVQILRASSPHFQGVTKFHERVTFGRQLDGSAGSRVENPYSRLPSSSFTGFCQQQQPQPLTFMQQQPQLPPKPQSSAHQQQHQQQPSMFAYQQPQPFGYQTTFTQQQVPSSFEAHKEPQSSACQQLPPPPTFTLQPFGHQQPPPPPPTFMQQQPSTFAYQQPQPSGYQTTLTQQQGPSSFETHQGPQSSACQQPPPAWPQPSGHRHPIPPPTFAHHQPPSSSKGQQQPFGDPSLNRSTFTNQSFRSRELASGQELLP
ncbi:hypothetical protein EDD18DRAFT_1356641 [Armillaria luteobubalina]|uniref:Uncharacterized protein n=1 Tax=Armillaria luteobubalina TaxID=153913 RepID=A0AA39Q0S2_9AGAR|nr:hypothetical protein EDD18DRAFT_1356641 [Armillaria luteobubalina]